VSPFIGIAKPTLVGAGFSRDTFSEPDLDKKRMNQGLGEA
jgi:hypothetical protein